MANTCVQKVEKDYPGRISFVRVCRVRFGFSVILNYTAFGFSGIGILLIRVYSSALSAQARRDGAQPPKNCRRNCFLDVSVVAWRPRRSARWFSAAGGRLGSFPGLVSRCSPLLLISLVLFFSLLPRSAVALHEATLERV